MRIQKSMLKTYFLTGLLVLTPIMITLWVLSLVLGAMDQTLTLLPDAWQPKRLFGFNLPGLGTILSLAFVFLVGLFAQNFIGKTFVQWWEAILRRIPLVGPLYMSVKQVSDTLLSKDGTAFRKALLIEYPRPGVYSIAFLTGVPTAEITDHLSDDYVNVYVPTTPNPTSGFFLLLPRTEVIELAMTPEAALKYIVSMGVVTPLAQTRR